MFVPISFVLLLLHRHVVGRSLEHPHALTQGLGPWPSQEVQGALQGGGGVLNLGLLKSPNPGTRGGGGGLKVTLV